MNMIRNVSSRDAKAIVDIYNEYVVNSVATFETEPLRVEEMEGRIAGISASYPYLVYVDHDEVVGYCYAHAWKEKAAYKYTLETTVYLSPRYKGKGSRPAAYGKADRGMSGRRLPRLDCLHYRGE